MDTKPASETNKFADAFNEMSERIRRNEMKDFGGAFLYVPPKGDPIGAMIADPAQDPEAFLAFCMGKLAVLQQEIQISKTGGYPQRR